MTYLIRPVICHVAQREKKLLDGTDKDCLFMDQSNSEPDMKQNSMVYIRVTAVDELYRYRIVIDFVTSSSPVPLKTCRVGQRSTLNLSRAATSSR
ncbi:hypothetical protein TNCV_2629521 [Trichonephila clavipes]|uniref:Uncharacterized protein n=1 Tax=Trichonephila clavipes TaxID=2585209 RepID=A0A8X6SF20_TRICX|nr:hypothetical protein TNCV_2629521 [Trichonephila clavipes]